MPLSRMVSSFSIIGWFSMSAVPCGAKSREDEETAAASEIRIELLAAGREEGGNVLRVMGITAQCER